MPETASDRCGPPSWWPRRLAAVRGLPAASTSEVRGLVRDGFLTRAAPGRLLPRDLTLSCADRAAALRPLLPPGGVVVLGAAAWVHLGGAAPVVVDIALPVPRRSRDPRVRLRVTHYGDARVLRSGDVRVTTRVQTVADLLRVAGAHPADPAPRREIRRLLGADTDPARVRALLLSEPGRAGRRAALEALEALEVLRART